MGGAPERLVITAAQRQQVFDHCLDHRPNEACGLIGGKGERVERVYPAHNKEQSPIRYEIDPKDLIRIFRDIDDADLELIAIFHSHVFTQAYPSQTDVRLAHYPDALYVLVSLANEREPIMRAYTILEGQITEVDVVVEP